MRTKTLLLAAAALASGLISSQAQTVYSQNIVGYANVVCPATVNSMLACPFKIGVSNGADEVYGLNANPAAIPAQSTVLIYSTAAQTIGLFNVGQALGVNGTLNVPAQSYITYFYDPQYVGSGYGAWWTDSGYGNNIPTPTLPPGQAYFISPATAFTNVYAGTVAVNVGATNSVNLPATVNSMVASAIPFGGDVTVSTAGALTNNLPAQSTVLIYSTAATTIPLSNVGQVLGVNGTLNVPAQSYVTYFYDPQYVSSGYGAWWTDSGYGNNMPAPSLSVGQGMFISPASSFTWQQTLNP